MAKKYGYELELLFDRNRLGTKGVGDIHAVLETIPDRPDLIETEIYRQMIEFISGVCNSPHDAVTEVMQKVSIVEAAGFHFEPHATYVGYEPGWLDIKTDLVVLERSEEARKKKQQYFEYLLDEYAKMRAFRAQDICMAGGHFTGSDPSWSEDHIVQSCDAMTALSFLPVALAGNAPKGGLISDRTKRWPFIFTNPFKNANAYRAWISEMERRRLLYPGKNRGWTIAAPRFQNGDINDPIDRAEFRGMPGGRNVVPAVQAELGELFLDRIPENLAEIGEIPSGMEVWRNMTLVNHFGVEALITLNGKRVRAADVIQDWIDDMPALEQAFEVAKERGEQERYDHEVDVNWEEAPEDLRPAFLEQPVQTPRRAAK